MTRCSRGICVTIGCLAPAGAVAHVSEQGFVLLLPTAAYTAAGVAAVALTVLALAVLPAGLLRRLFAWRPLAGRSPGRGRDVTSLMSATAMVFVLILGAVGPRDPLQNLLPLSFWTLGWVALVTLSGVVGNLWHWVNPWTGLYRLTGPPRPMLRLPEALGLWPAVTLLIGFAGFMLADIAPDDPARLTRVLVIYWVLTFTGLLLFGPRWLMQVELGHAIFAAYARLAPLRLGPWGGIGGPGWRVLARPPTRAAGVLALTLLAAGSFDGLSGTFWWLARIGVNPLEFPGRSAVIGPTWAGLALTWLCLLAAFALCVRAGRWLSGAGPGFARCFDRLALGLLPIALVYHAAHYLPSFLVEVQYVLAALSDPLGQGADLLGIEPFHVTTGFFNRLDTVRLIWTAQAGLVVLGHIWSVLLSHRIALQLFRDDGRATLATLPLSLFMIAYTFLGLWLLAAPKGA